MPELTFKDPTGKEHTFDVVEGVTVMSTAKKNGVRGIVAECGGSLTCASCHVYVDEEWLDQTGEVSDNEDEMLDEVVCPREPNSRLSCQIVMTEQLDGLTVQVPDRQQ